MLHDPARLKADMDQLAMRAEPFARVIERVGYPAPRVQAQGYETLLRTIVGQQVSVAAAASVWRRLEEAIGPACPPDAILAQDEETLRACGLSRQKQGYARSLAKLIVSGEVNLAALPDDDEEAIARLVRIKGIGRWSAEIYLLFAEGRPDIWPAGDLAVQIEIGRLFGLPDRPSERMIRALAEDWHPHRGSAAILAWHSYNSPPL